VTDGAWQITIDPQPDRTTVQIVGDLDLETAPSLLAQVEPYLAERDGALVVYLGGLTFIDSTGLSALIRINQRMSAAGRVFEIISPRPTVAKAFQVTGLNQVLPLRERTG
jgi:anti-sigma B factor antagonist